MDFRNSGFIELFKRAREKFGVSIDEAHDLIFSDEEIRRLKTSRINRDPVCRKLAHQDMHRNGAQSGLVVAEERIACRRKDGLRSV
jgi:hypothetical protein